MYMLCIFCSRKPGCRWGANYETLLVSAASNSSRGRSGTQRGQRTSLTILSGDVYSLLLSAIPEKSKSCITCLNHLIPLACPRGVYADMLLRFCPLRRGMLNTLVHRMYTHTFTGPMSRQRKKYRFTVDLGIYLCKSLGVK